MKQLALNNPFVVGRYVGDEYFCDRAAETDFLIKQMENGRNVAIVSPRRMGKTGLIRHCFGQERMAGWNTFFIDIYATTSLDEFVYLLGKSIYEQLKSRGRALVERFFSIISSLRMGFKFDASSGEPVLDIGLGDIHVPQTTLDEIFRYLETSEKPCVVAIDEFQQIGTYADSNVEAMLRTMMQQCRRTVFVFAGSRRHVMNNMFNSPSKPFYQSAVTMGLEPIEAGVYSDFAVRMFAGRGRRLDSGVPGQVHAMFDGCTWFVQMVMNELFAMTPEGGVCDVTMVDTALENVVMSQESAYREILSHVTPKQKLVLAAIAREGTARAVTSAKFVKKYGLASASAVQAAIKLLLKNDMVTQENGGYRVYDYFFSRWLAAEY